MPSRPPRAPPDKDIYLLTPAPNVASPPAPLLGNMPRSASSVVPSPNLPPRRPRTTTPPSVQNYRPYHQQNNYYNHNSNHYHQPASSSSRSLHPPSFQRERDYSSSRSHSLSRAPAAHHSYHRTQQQSNYPVQLSKRSYFQNYGYQDSQHRDTRSYHPSSSSHGKYYPRHGREYYRKYYREKENEVKRTDEDKRGDGEEEEEEGQIFQNGDVQSGKIEDAGLEEGEHTKDEGKEKGEEGEISPAQVIGSETKDYQQADDEAKRVHVENHKTFRPHRIGRSRWSNLSKPDAPVYPAVEKRESYDFTRHRGGRREGLSRYYKGGERRSYYVGKERRSYYDEDGRRPYYKSQERRSYNWDSDEHSHDNKREKRSYYDREREEKQYQRRRKGSSFSPSENQEEYTSVENGIRHSRPSSCPATASPQDTQSLANSHSQDADVPAQSQEREPSVPLGPIARWAEGRSDPRTQDASTRATPSKLYRKRATVLRPFISDENDVKTGDERCVLLSKLSDNASDAFLVDFMSRFGRVLRVRVARSRSGRHLGMARVVFAKRVYGMRALKNDGLKIMGQRIHIEKDVLQVLMESRVKQIERAKEYSKTKELERKKRYIEMRKKERDAMRLLAKQKKEEEERRLKEREREQLQKESQRKGYNVEDDPGTDPGISEDGGRFESRDNGVLIPSRPKGTNGSNANGYDPDTPTKQHKSRSRDRSFHSLKLMMLPSTIKYDDLAKAFSYLKSIHWILRQGPYWHLLFRRRSDRDEAKMTVDRLHGDQRVNGAKFLMQADCLTIRENDLEKKKEEPARDVDDLVNKLWNDVQKSVSKSVLTKVNLSLNRYAGNVVLEEIQRAHERTKNARAKNNSATVNSVPTGLKMDEEALASLSMFKKVTVDQTQTDEHNESSKRARDDTGSSSDEMSDGYVLRKRRRTRDTSSDADSTVDLEELQDRKQSGMLRRLEMDDSDSEQDEPMPDFDATDWDSPHAKAALAEELCKNLEYESERSSDLQRDPSWSPSSSLEPEVVHMEVEAVGPTPESDNDYANSESHEEKNTLDTHDLKKGLDAVRAEFSEEEIEVPVVLDLEKVTCARSMVFNRDIFDKTKRWMANQGNLVLPQSINNFVSARESRRETRLFRKGISGFGKSDVLTLSHLNQRKKNVKFSQSKIHGMGLFAQEIIEPEEFVIEYMGELIRPTIGDIREEAYIKRGMGDFYLFRVNRNTLIDATRKGCVARFINHSCDPNLYAKKIVVANQEKIVFYGKRRVSIGEELTYDYKLEYEQEDQKVQCLCGSATCQGYLNYCQRK